jgi:Cu-Zn family superoxide dismutase
MTLGNYFAGVSSMKLTTAAIASFISLAFLSACKTSEHSSHSSTTSVAPAKTNKAAVVAMAVLSPASGSSVHGTVYFIRESENKIRVEASVSGLTPGKHGFHIHEKGDCAAPDASSAGGHFNPTGMQHGGPGQHNRHVGDFGNIEADSSGNAKYSANFTDLTIEGTASIIDKAVIVHAKADDLKTQPSGDAGGRVACGVINKK